MSASAKPAASAVIQVLKNGPLTARNVPRVLDARGRRLAPRKLLSLCRCGASGNKPFCDGSHGKAGFKDDKLPGRVPDRCYSYKGKRITIHDNRGVCAHAGFCTDNLKTVWRMGVEPWIDPDGASVEEIIRVIAMCPSGALSYSLDGRESHPQDSAPTIRITADGPFAVAGGVALQNASWGEGTAKDHYTLCRCGASKNKPFCDGSHWHVAFKDKGLAPDEALADAGGDKAAGALRWHKVAEVGDLAEGGVRAVSAGGVRIALTNVKGTYGALAARCPHQGGPLGEGVIEDCWLHCPWHGWGFHALRGHAPEGADYEGVATYPLEARSDGIYVGVGAVKARPRTVSNVMAETMVNWGVAYVFGMVGHSNLGLADALRSLEEKGRITFIGIRHEGAAAFACSGYAKLSGKPAACLTIAGPGATNLMTGLWDARMDRAPVLALTGQVNTQVLGPGAFQEIDQMSAFEAVSGFNQTVLHNSNHAELMTLALKHAVVERQVAHLIFPDEVQNLAAKSEAQPSSPEGRLAATAIAPPEDSLAQAVSRLTKAQRPAVIIGYGAGESLSDVVALATRLHAPMLTTFKAKGVIEDSHPLAAGVLGRSGTPVASWAMNDSDLLLVFGASFADHTGIDKRKCLIQVDFDRMALGKFHGVDVPVWGDIGVTARALLERLPSSCKPADRRASLNKHWTMWRKEKARRASENRGHGINAATVFSELSRLAPADAVVAVDVGNNAYSFGRYFECRRQSILMSGYLGSIGFAFPAAMGAWAALQVEGSKRCVLSVSGDGGFGQYMGEFTTAVKYGMGIVHVLLNNGELAKITKEQRDGRWQVWQTSLHNPNFADYARICGGFGIRVTKENALEDALKKALAHARNNKNPALVELMTDAELN